MTHTDTNEKAPGATNSKGLHSTINGDNFRTDGAIQQARDGNTVAARQDLALTTTSAEARVDTRLLARQLGNKHKPVIALIDKYLDSFKAHGQVLFKKADGDRKQGGGRAERYALLANDFRAIQDADLVVPWDEALKRIVPGSKAVQHG